MGYIILNMLLVIIAYYVGKHEAKLEYERRFAVALAAMRHRVREVLDLCGVKFDR